LEVGSAEGLYPFEPPKYLASLIAAVNDGAKAAQASALLFLVVGVYLVATAFSASDEDLLLGRTVTFSQIGVALPVVFSFGVAPIVFVFLHVSTLVRYDMLAANVREFLTELCRTGLSHGDRERCRQLLANVEFVQALVSSPYSPSHSLLWRWLVLVVVGVFPVFVLIIVQINSLRYQGDFINRVQQCLLLLDLAALGWFFWRNLLSRPSQDRKNPGTRLIKLLGIPFVIMVLDVIYLNVVPAEADVRLVRYAKSRGFKLMDLISQPVDVVLCGAKKNWGCRYLHIEQRILVNRVWNNRAIPDLRNKKGDRATALAGIESVDLRDRNLRFAVLNKSSLYSADLSGADLRKATLDRASLHEANLNATEVQSGAQLQGATLTNAQLAGAKLMGAKLQGAQLSNASLEGADLTEAHLEAANLSSAQLQGADLSRAYLEAADLTAARLQGATLISTHLEIAHLSAAELQGADLTGAHLDGASLNGANLQGADLRLSFLWRAELNADIGLSDFSKAQFTKPLTDKDKASIKNDIDSIPDKEIRENAAERLNKLFESNQDRQSITFSASSERPSLADQDSQLMKNPSSVIAASTPYYINALSKFLIYDASLQDQAIAEGISRRLREEMIRYYKNGEPSFYKSIACQLVIKAARTKISSAEVNKLSRFLNEKKESCPEIFSESGD
jgi:uncharacterized protein YjbI with pentapeptide repeats